MHEVALTDAAKEPAAQYEQLLGAETMLPAGHMVAHCEEPGTETVSPEHASQGAPLPALEKPAEQGVHDEDPGADDEPELHTVQSPPAVL